MSEESLLHLSAFDDQKRTCRRRNDKTVWSARVKTCRQQLNVFHKQCAHFYLQIEVKSTMETYCEKLDETKISLNKVDLLLEEKRRWSLYDEFFPL